MGEGLLELPVLDGPGQATEGITLNLTLTLTQLPQLLYPCSHSYCQTRKLLLTLALKGVMDVVIALLQFNPCLVIEQSIIRCEPSPQLSPI